MNASRGYDYQGEAALEPSIARALHRVIDPEMALDIVELGLVYGVRATAEAASVRVTMTSAACPVVELIVAGIEDELRAELGEAARIDVDVVWDPPWEPHRMSERARNAMGWE